MPADRIHTMQYMQDLNERERKADQDLNEDIRKHGLTVRGTLYLRNN